MKSSNLDFLLQKQNFQTFSFIERRNANNDYLV